MDNPFIESSNDRKKYKRFGRPANLTPVPETQPKTHHPKGDCVCKRPARAVGGEVLRSGRMYWGYEACLLCGKLPDKKFVGARRVGGGR